MNLAIAVCMTLLTPQNTATALDGVVTEARKLTPSFSCTAPLPEINVTTVAGGCVGAGKSSTAVGGTPPQFMNGTAALGRLATEWQWRGASLHPFRMIMRRRWLRSLACERRRRPSAAPRPRPISTMRREREQRRRWVIWWSLLASLRKEAL